MEIPHARFDVRLATADLRHVAGRAATGGGGGAVAEPDVAGVEREVLGREAVEGARERRFVDRWIHGPRRMRIETGVGAAIALQRLLDQQFVIDRGRDGRGWRNGRGWWGNGGDNGFRVRRSRFGARG